MANILSTTQALESLVQHQPFNPDKEVTGLKAARNFFIGVTAAGVAGMNYFGPTWLQVVSGISAAGGLLATIHSYHEQRDFANRELLGLENEGFYHIHDGFTNMTSPLERARYTKIVPIEETEEPWYSLVDEQNTWIAMNGVLVRRQDEYHHFERDEHADGYSVISYYDYTLDVKHKADEIRLKNRFSKPFAHKDMVETGKPLFCIAGRGPSDRLEMQYLGLPIEEGVAPVIHKIERYI